MYDASQFGQLNRLTEDFGMCYPVHGNQLGQGWEPPIRTHKLMLVSFRPLVNSL